MSMSNCNPSNGRAFIEGKDVHRNKKYVRNRIGYCPQEMALVELLTAREHLELFSEIRCVKRNQIKPLIDNLLEGMDLTMNKNNLVGRYSGGNKRKLMVAVAMCGDPSVVFLDEPSSGMDPVAKRSMWKIIEQIKTKGTSVILTTHNMEEAEALASRLAIMHLGRIRCIGPPQYLKDKFSKGYEIDIKYNKPNDEQIQEMCTTYELNITDKLDAIKVNQILDKENKISLTHIESIGIAKHITNTIKNYKIVDASMIFEFIITDN